MGTETRYIRKNLHKIPHRVKLNNPLMGTETFSAGFSAFLVD